MCNRVATPEKDELEGYFDKDVPNPHALGNLDGYNPYYHITAFTAPFLPFIGRDNKRSIAPAMWKFIPTGATFEAYAQYDTCNARAEEIFEKRTYKDFILPNRGLVLLKGFFEGQKQANKKTQPYFIYPANGELLTIGCVYSDWYDKVNQITVRTFAMITTAANQLMSEIHNTKLRMPLIVPAERRDWWLGERTKAELQEYMVPYPDGYLKAHKVDKSLYNSRIDTNKPEILQPFNDTLF